MSRGPEETRRSAGLDAVVEEAKAAFAPERVDWSSIEARLEEQVQRERAALALEVRADARRARWLRGAAAAAAVAAALAVFVRRAPDAAVEVQDAPAEAAPASALRSTDRPGAVRIGGVVASTGHAVRAGDAIEAPGRAVFERTRKVVWMMEGGAAPARVRVKSASEALVLALEDGVVEAQVTPVAQGEAFAIDVAEGSSVVRVAVHGTHLRVARSGSRVTVDLTEGVVSIGAPPRVGPTYGTLVTAPAHVELDVHDLAGSLRVDHAQAAVRPAVALGAEDPLASARLDPATPPVAPAPAPAPSPAAPALARTDPTPPSKPEVAAPSPSPRAAISAAVRECAAAKRREGAVRVTVSSSLLLRVSAAGQVESARFDPPLMPEIQSCAAATIYATKLDETGAVTIPIDFSY